MKEKEFHYRIYRDNSPEIFKKHTRIIQNAFPDFDKRELLIDVDGSTYQEFEKDGKEIVLFDDYDIGAVFVDSDVDMSKIYKKDVFNDSLY